jgi:hypothetical protein
MTRPGAMLNNLDTLLRALANYGRGPDILAGWYAIAGTQLAVLDTLLSIGARPPLAPYQR